MKKVTIIVLLVVVFTLAISISPVSACYNCGPGVGTPGYWKNHPEAWPVDVILIKELEFTKTEAIQLMKTPEKGDKSLTLFRAYVATYLNLADGNCDECIIGWLDWAERWLSYNPPGSGVRASSDEWHLHDGENIYNHLDAYNNGLRCAAPRD